MDEAQYNLEVSKRNGNTVLQVLAKQDLKIQEQQQRIDLLNTAIANLTLKLTTIESMLIVQKIQSMGHGPTV